MNKPKTDDVVRFLDKVIIWGTYITSLLKTIQFFRDQLGTTSSLKEDKESEKGS